MHQPLRLALFALPLTLAALACDPAKVLEDAAKESPIVPDDDTARLMEFEEMLNKGAFTQLIKEMPAYLEKHENSYQGHNLLGWAYLKTDAYDDAMKHFEKSVEINPKWDNGFVGQGAVWRARGDLDKASAAYHKAIELVPSNPEAYGSLVVVEIKRGDMKEAVKMGEKAWALSDKTDPTLASNLCIAYHYDGQETKRDEMYGKAKELGYLNMATLDQIIAGEIDVR